MATSVAEDISLPCSKSFQSTIEESILQLGELDLTSEDFLLDEVDSHIQQNLEDEIVKEALNKGVDLRQYSKQVERELLEVENASIQDYIKESQNIASLHSQIAACDGILERMEQMLNGFQSDLSSISTEIQSLQDQSIAMNIKLKNRQAIRGELSQYVDEMVIPESMISHILETPVTEDEFKEQLHELNHKIKFVKEQAFRDARACGDVKDILERLKVKALAKIREFLLQRIYAFRKPMANYQIPQNTLLKFRIFNEFLMTNERHVAKEVRDEYVDTMSKVYYSYFKSYSSRLMKLQFEEVATRDDLMGVEDTAKKDILVPYNSSFFSSKPQLKNRSTVFTLGNRGDVLTTGLEEPVIIPHAAAKNETRYTFEMLFRSLHFALMDNCCREYLFLCDFFIVSGTGAQSLFDAIFGKTLTMFMKQMEEYVGDSYDSIAMFLSVHIVYRYRAIMAKRGIPCLDRYWEALLNTMWPRFEYILHLNIQSVHHATLRGVFGSHCGRGPDVPSERVGRVLGQLQAEVENFVLKMAAQFQQRREQLIFLINNYDMMLAVLVERTSEDSKEAEVIRDLLTARTGEYVEEVLAPHFGGMITFVRDCENLVDKGQLDTFANQEKRVQQIIRGFNNDWKKALETINQEVMRAFTNFKNGTQILQFNNYAEQQLGVLMFPAASDRRLLQGALTQLIQYYHRFQKVMSQGPFRSMQVRNELINIHHVMVEVKRYKPTF
ncbi:hypothetical protein C0Q70_17532 [Pomacea canaliculata]|uniref:Vacuolar protein sorting-associated protein 52 homolog n=1 Tax=Pomacea canaliculata TaxID=400727 RepID=A0A2T7NKP0_POMCA|nr:hypothetical protein C0Q70_17532 [Pomacea canaliculata]